MGNLDSRLTSDLLSLGHPVRYQAAAHLHDLRLLVCREQVGHLACVEQTVDVLQERLLLDLRVRDEEDGRLALHPRALQHTLHKQMSTSQSTLTDTIPDETGTHRIIGIQIFCEWSWTAPGH